MRNRRASVLGIGAALICGVIVWCGCGRDAHLAGKALRHAKVGPVTHFGVTLDQNASPEQAAFVSLRAIREDFLAKSPAERENALDVQFDTAAVDVIASKNRAALSRDEIVHYVVTEWTPTVSHYVNDFETEAEKGVARLVRRMTGKQDENGVEECELAMEVADPKGDPNARVVMLVWLAKDGGYWRVVHFGFEPKRTLASKERPAAGTESALP